MKQLLFCILLAGCAASLDTLMIEAKDCTDNAISPTGLIGKPTDEQRTACWVNVNNRLESIERRRKKVEAGKCPSGMIMYCIGKRERGGECGCVRRDQFGW